VVKKVVANREAFGDNTMPEAPMKYFIVLFIESFNDPVLLVLIAASIVSLILGLFGPHAEDEPYGWIEGAAIMIAVFVVAIVTAGNDYSKELQFRALAKFAATLESCAVLRDGGTRKVLNPTELVAGDVVSIKGGDQVFADAVLVDCDAKSGLAMDEAALTGESELVHKNSVAGAVHHHGKDPSEVDSFLLSSTVCSTHGNAEDAKAIVIGVGASSQWGRIKANLEQEERNTPLQDKLEVSAVGVEKEFAAPLFSLFIGFIVYPFHLFGPLSADVLSFFQLIHCILFRAF
jgi:magnesium-transporting ATPase (P-type)